jgi:hypothetical protein
MFPGTMISRVETGVATLQGMPNDVPYTAIPVNRTTIVRAKRCSRSRRTGWQLRANSTTSTAPRNRGLNLHHHIFRRATTSAAPTNRQCSHCGLQKTPQWRQGPLGAKTLCNACGVRYKSGRLLPEYRPASSPSFLEELHSNSHKKVMELRRRKEHGARQGRGAA